MFDIEHEKSVLESHLTDFHKSLERINYGRFVKLGSIMRAGVPGSLNNPDIPPVSLKLAIDAVKACEELVSELKEADITSTLISNSETIRKVLSTDIIPQIDLAVVSQKELKELIEIAKKSELTGSNIKLKSLDIKKLSAYLTVNYADPGNYRNRPSIGGERGKRRLRTLTVMSRMIFSGMLTCANIGIGALCGVLSFIPAITAGSVSPLMGIVGSTYTGLMGVITAIEKLAGILESDAA